MLGGKVCTCGRMLRSWPPRGSIKPAWFSRWVKDIRKNHLDNLHYTSPIRTSVRDSNYRQHEVRYYHCLLLCPFCVCSHGAECLRSGRKCNPILWCMFLLFILSHLCHDSSPLCFGTQAHITQVPCISSAAAGVGCGADSYSCRCNNADAIQNAAIGCVLTNCGLTTGLQVQASASAVCACVATAVPDAAKLKARAVGW